jgi:hypothetical protein
VIARATAISDELARVIHDKRLYARIGGKEHVLVEGWALLGSMLGLFPYTVWTRPLPDGWEARVEARTLTGHPIAAAEAECLRSERKWARADDYAVRSMAQTRAVSKALRQPLGFVMLLAGFDATPGEEIPPEDEPGEKNGPIPPEIRPSPDQLERIKELLARLAEAAPSGDWGRKALDLAGVPYTMLTATAASRVIDGLAVMLAELDRAA